MVFDLASEYFQGWTLHNPSGQPGTFTVLYKDLADQWRQKREEILNIIHRVFPSETMDVGLNCGSVMKSALRNIICLSLVTKQG